MKKSTDTENKKTSRRDFLKKAGKAAVLAPPAMILLSRPSRAGILQSGDARQCEDDDYQGESNLKRMITSYFGR